MQIEILNSFAGDKKKEIDTATEDGRQAAAKIVGDMLRSGSAVFLEREINGETYTYRVTGYDPQANKLTIKLDTSQVKDSAIEQSKPRKGRPRSNVYGRISPEAGRTVSVAPRSGG